MSSRDRLKQLERIESDLVSVLECAGQSLLELSKENPTEDYVITTTSQFLKGLEGIERALNEQISYLSNATTNQAHEGGTYGHEKHFQLVCETTNSILNRLNSLTVKKESN